MTILVKRLILLDDFETNTYLVWSKGDKTAIVIDPAAKPQELFEEIKKLSLDIKYIINTHGHADHIGANRTLKKLTGAKICIHALDKELFSDPDKNFSSFVDIEVTSPAPDILLQGQDEVVFGEAKFVVIHTPGHSGGSICLYGHEMLFSGDTLFFEGLGRTDLPGSNQSDIVHSINKKLFKLPDKTKVFPGHGGFTNIKHEKQYNPVTLF